MSILYIGSQTTNSFVITGDGTGNLVIQTGNTATTAVTIDNTQKVTFANSIGFGSNAGITFNNSSALTNSTLNDYETGTWTPVIGGNTQTNAGWYVKVGRLVTLGVDNCYASTALATSAQLTITNLPFAVSGTNVGGCASSVSVSIISTGYKDYQMSSRIYSTTLWTATNNSGIAVTSSDIWNLGGTYLASF